VQIAALTAVLTAAANAVVFDPVVTVVRAKVGLDLALTGPLNAVLSALAPHRPVLLMQTAISASQPDLARAKRWTAKKAAIGKNAPRPKRAPSLLQRRAPKRAAVLRTLMTTSEAL